MEKSNYHSTVAVNSETMAPKSAWTEVVAAKRAIRDKHIEEHRSTSVNSSPAAKITKISDIDSLTRLIESGDVSAEDVVKAYIAK